MKVLFFFFMVLIAFATTSCSKEAKSETKTPPPTSTPSGTCTVCGCEVKLSEVKWYQGTLCPAGLLSQGHGKNAQGQEVSGCYELIHEDGSKK